MGLPNGTVGMFLIVLTSEITKWDRKYNRTPYALGIMLGAAEEVRAEVQDVIDSESTEHLARLYHSIERHFTKMRWRDSVLRQIEKFIETGKTPTLTKPVRGRGEAGY